LNDIAVVADDFIEKIVSSSNIVALTGAGISTESGIPDYRSPVTGLWEKMDQSVVSIDGFIQNPTRYYDYALELYPVRRSAKPNPAHYLLAELERRGKLRGVITQNVDGLHQDAGSITVHELHGSLRQVVCLSCDNLVPTEDAMEKVVSGENPPLCKECGGVLKPNAVFFGEALPQVPWQNSVELAKNADIFISLGSSLQVSPANMLPDIALNSNARLIIVNLTETPYDGDADLLIRHRIGEFSAEVMQKLSPS